MAHEWHMDGAGLVVSRMVVCGGFTPAVREVGACRHREGERIRLSSESVGAASGPDLESNFFCQKR